MGYYIFSNLKVGDRLTITENPGNWSSAAGGRYVRDELDYPYTLIIENISLVNKTPHIAILDTNGYGWSISNLTYHLFTRESVLDKRRAKINGLNIP